MCLGHTRIWTHEKNTENRIKITSTINSYFQIGVNYESSETGSELNDKGKTEYNGIVQCIFNKITTDHKLVMWVDCTFHQKWLLFFCGRIDYNKIMEHDQETTIVKNSDKNKLFSFMEDISWAFNFLRFCVNNFCSFQWRFEPKFNYVFIIMGIICPYYLC